MHGLVELRRAEEWARRRSRGHRRVGAADEGAQAVLGGDKTRRSIEAPAEQVSLRDLTMRQGLDDLEPVLPGAFGLEHPDARGIPRVQEHGLAPLAVGLVNPIHPREGLYDRKTPFFKTLV